MLDQEFRDAGFTEQARKYPRTKIEFEAICAWNNIKPDDAPEAWRYFPNESTQNAWRRVIEAILYHE